MLYAETSEEPLSEEKRSNCLYIQKYKLHNENNRSAFFLKIFLKVSTWLTPGVLKSG
jgi:hypothetical protein